MNFIQNFMTENGCFKQGRTIVPKGVMVHSTGANNPNLRRYVQPNVYGIGANNNSNDWNRESQLLCVHAFIGKLADGSIAAVQVMPWNYRASHCGVAYKNGPSANNTHIAFEICEDGLTSADYFNSVYQEAVELTAYLCKTYELNPLADGVVICHREGYDRGVASGHADVLHWFPTFGKTMDDFRADVAAVINGTTTPTAETTTTIKTNEEDEDMVRYERVSDIPNEYGFQDVINTLMDAGIIKGDGSDTSGNNDVIDLSHDQVRSLVFEYRGGAFDRKLIAVGMEPAVVA